MERALVRFREVVRRKDLKKSQAREKVARAALMQNGHFTVEELARELGGGGSSQIHLTTIYRAIPLLIEAGLIQQASVPHGDTQRFERAFEREHHDHLVCISCGAMVEFHSEALEALQREIAERYGYRLDEHALEMRGRCAKCLRKR